MLAGPTAAPPAMPSAGASSGGDRAAAGNAAASDPTAAPLVAPRPTYPRKRGHGLNGPPRRVVLPPSESPPVRAPPPVQQPGAPPGGCVPAAEDCGLGPAAGVPDTQAGGFDDLFPPRPPRSVPPSEAGRPSVSSAPPARDVPVGIPPDGRRPPAAAASCRTPSQRPPVQRPVAPSASASRRGAGHGCQP